MKIKYQSDGIHIEQEGLIDPSKVGTLDMTVTYDDETTETYTLLCYESGVESGVEEVSMFATESAEEDETEVDTEEPAEVDD